jgi:uncharacterized membrane protein (DUF2068 family)
MTSAKRQKNSITAAPRHTKGLHIVALFEGAKGVLVLLAGFGLLAIIHKDIHDIAARLIANFHFNPASHYPRIFLDLLERLDDHKLWAMAWAALLYSSMRLAEAIGLWLRKKWAEWFGVLSGGIYLPVEIYELSLGTTWPKVTVFVINLSVVLYLLFVLIRNGGNGR